MNFKPTVLSVLLAAVPLATTVTAQAGSALPVFGQQPSGVQTLSASGSSGSLNVPDGRTLHDGTVVLGLNNFLDPQFASISPRAENYQFGIGLFEYLELSGRLANMPVNRRGDLGVRDLSANLKVSLPKLFHYQPEIAFGINDLGGGTSTFKSKYVAVSQAFGPLRLNVGKAHGQPYLSRTFGSAELALGDTGVSLFAERNDSAYHAGLRYGSAPIAALGNARLVGTVQRSIRARTPQGLPFDRSTLGLSLVIPFGENARNPRPIAPENEPIWTPPPPIAAALAAPAVAVAAAVWSPASGVRPPAAVSVPTLGGDNALARVRTELIKAGLERVRVGQSGNELVVEYENHRYNQNEVDAVGIVLGVAAVLAPADIVTVSAVSKKAGLAIFKASVDRGGYRQFLRDGDAFEVKESVTLQYHPNERAVTWQDEEGPRGYSRVRIDPQLVKFVGTELGVFDYSLAANIQAMVPLWTGAELTTSFITTLSESPNVAHGFLGYAQQRNGLKSAVVSQALWVTDNVLNVTSAGRFLYGDPGIQNETIWMVPGRDDQLRAQFTRTKHTDPYRVHESENGSISYLWKYAPLSVWVETGYNKYVGDDRGPFLQVSRWFGDIQAQMYVRKSELETRIGFSLAMPLTPRQGMRPGWTHLEGASSFPFKLETKYARPGECNCITQGVVEEMAYVYSARMNLLNQGRLGKDYLAGQLQRMREAAILYAPAVQ